MNKKKEYSLSDFEVMLLHYKESNFMHFCTAFDELKFKTNFKSLFFCKILS
jgi:hypothetical protein